MKEISDAASKNKIVIKKNEKIVAQNVTTTPLYSEEINHTFKDTPKNNSTQDLRQKNVTQLEKKIN